MAAQIRPQPTSKRSRTGSFSNLSDSLTLQDAPSTHVIVRTAQTLGSRAIPGIWGGIRSSIDRAEVRDSESAIPAQQQPEATNNNNDNFERPAGPLRVRAGVITAVHAATKMFWKGTARNVPRMSPISARAPNNFSNCKDLKYQSITI